MAFLTVLASLITEITSNAATAAVILPVVNQAALSMKINPLYFSIPVTIGVSFGKFKLLILKSKSKTFKITGFFFCLFRNAAFVLPVASPCVSYLTGLMKLTKQTHLKLKFFIKIFIYFFNKECIGL